MRSQRGSRRGSDLFSVTSAKFGNLVTSLNYDQEILVKTASQFSPRRQIEGAQNSTTALMNKTMFFNAHF
jgi:hypothetical protein